MFDQLFNDVLDFAITATSPKSKRIDLKILKQTVNAKTRRLKAKWTFETTEDAEAIHGIDIEEEILASQLYSENLAGQPSPDEQVAAELAAVRMYTA